MRIAIAVTAASLALAGCATQTTIPAQPAPPAPSGPQPAGYADGTKIVNTSNLIFTAMSKGVSADFTTLTPVDVPISYRTTLDPNIIVATVNGQEIQMNLDPVGSVYAGSNANYFISAGVIQTSADQQVSLGKYAIMDVTAGRVDTTAFYTAGLETDPASITAATRGGSATYTGSTEIILFHGTPSTGNTIGYGSGNGALNANFATGAVSGTMSFTEGTIFAGGPMFSDFGYALSPTTIAINSTTISGNGFNSTLAIIPADLSMSSVASSSISGTFFGVNASDVGATFNGSGVSADGTTPVVFIGGFLGH